MCEDREMPLEVDTEKMNESLKSPEDGTRFNGDTWLDLHKDGDNIMSFEEGRLLQQAAAIKSAIEATEKALTPPDYPEIVEIVSNQLVVMRSDMLGRQKADARIIDFNSYKDKSKSGHQFRPSA